jgi:hypothetical protein
MLRQYLLHKLMFTEAGIPHHKQVESLLLDIDAKFDGFQRPILSKRLIQRLEICRGFKFNLPQTTGPVKFFIV